MKIDIALPSMTARDWLNMNITVAQHFTHAHALVVYDLN